MQKMAWKQQPARTRTAQKLLKGRLTAWKDSWKLLDLRSQKLKFPEALRCSQSDRMQ